MSASTGAITTSASIAEIFIGRELQRERRAGSFYRPELDALRFVAFLLVFIRHVTPFDPPMLVKYLHLPYSAAVIIANICQTGAFGVYLFFALSAYLITALLLREKEQYGKLHITQFYVRRALRIWPLYFFILVIGSIYSVCYPPFDYGTIPYFVFFSGNWMEVVGRIPSYVLAAMWSISVEEQFYLVWPPIVSNLSVSGIKTAAAVMLVVPALALPLGFALGFSGWHFAFMNSFSCVSAMGAGILVACCEIPRLPRWLLATTAAIAWYFAAALHLGDAPVTSVVAVALIVLGSSCLLIAAMGLTARPTFIELGKISYGLYVYHALAIAVTQQVMGRLAVSVKGYPMVIFGSFVLTIAMAFASYKLLEAPFLRLKERFTFVRSRPV